MKFKLLVFDWDGTLMDSEARIVACVKGAVRDLRIESPSDDEIRNIIGLGLREAMDMLFPTADETRRQAIINRYRVHYLDRNQTPSPLFDGAEAAIRTLAGQDYLLAVATGKSRAGLNRALDDSGLKAFFHSTRCADETFSKPHPQMLEEILDELGIFPQEALMIGDTEYDLQMAANAGVASLGVTYGVHRPQRLAQHKPLDCVHQVGAIPAWLENYHSQQI